ncbi:MAG TPA: glutamyl-tRNA reductase [Mycobacterium sp.]|nr:glutamyl-tRNA reductase [Mycobacterium sp.]
MLMVLGASHHDLELARLDRLTRHPTHLRRAITDITQRPNGPINGAGVVSTCNRLEIYLDARRFHDSVDQVTETLARVSDLSVAEVAGMLKVRVGTHAVTNLFTVAAGLDSMVAGEVEIAGQIARALREAQAAGTASPAINQLFQAAARTAKQVVSDTSLGNAGRSVASVALDIAAGDRDGAQQPGTTLIIGTGAYARVVATELRARGAHHLFVHSPSGRADAFAQRHSATVVPAEALVQTMSQVDLVVACSGQSAGMLDAPMLTATVAGRTSPLPIIDLALHSHLTDPARRVPGVRVVDLHTVQQSVDPAHLDAMASAREIVAAGVAAFEQRMTERQLDPAVVALREHVTGTVRKELDRLRAKYSADVTTDLERTLHRITQSVLHTPTLRAQELARAGDATEYVQALHTLFGIDVPNSKPTSTVPTLRLG